MMYLTSDFIVQQFIKDDSNIVLKARSFYESFAVDYMDGINEMTEVSGGMSTDFFTQPTTKVEDDPKIVTKEEIELVKHFQFNFLRRLGVNLAGIDYLLDTKTKTVLPVDFNNMPRIEKILNVRSLLESHMVKPVNQVHSQ